MLPPCFLSHEIAKIFEMDIQVLINILYLYASIFITPHCLWYREYFSHYLQFLWSKNTRPSEQRVNHCIGVPLTEDVHAYSA